MKRKEIVAQKERIWNIEVRKILSPWEWVQTVTGTFDDAIAAAAKQMKQPDVLDARFSELWTTGYTYCSDTW